MISRYKTIVVYTETNIGFRMIWMDYDFVMLCELKYGKYIDTSVRETQNTPNILWLANINTMIADARVPIGARPSSTKMLLVLPHSKRSVKWTPLSTYFEQRLPVEYCYDEMRYVLNYF